MCNDLLEKQLIEKKVRPTAIRLRVLDFFKNYHFAASLNDLEEVLGPVDRTTLFRTIRIFEKNGFLHRVNDENGGVKYAMCSDDCSCTFSDHLHVHFSCNYCHKTNCLYDIPVSDVTLPEGFIPLDASLVIKGICHHCST